MLSDFLSAAGSVPRHGPPLDVVRSQCLRDAQGRASRRMVALPTALVDSRSAKQTEYRMRVTSPRPAGTMALPGDAAPLRFFNDSRHHNVSGARPPSSTRSRRFSRCRLGLRAARAERTSARVSAWGRVPRPSPKRGVRGVTDSSIDNSAPARRSAQWYEEHATHAADCPNEQYRALLAQSSFGSSTHSHDAHAHPRHEGAASAIRAAGRGVKGAAHVLRVDMTVRTGASRGRPRVDAWLTEAEIANAHPPGL